MFLHKHHLDGYMTLISVVQQHIHQASNETLKAPATLHMLDKLHEQTIKLKQEVEYMNKIMLNNENEFNLVVALALKNDSMRLNPAIMSASETICVLVRDLLKHCEEIMSFTNKAARLEPSEMANLEKLLQIVHNKMKTISYNSQAFANNLKKLDSSIKNQFKLLRQEEITVEHLHHNMRSWIID